MAISELSGQRATSGNNAGVDSATLAYPGNVAAGNLLVVSGACWQSGSAPTSVSVTDTRGTSYSVLLGTVPTGLAWRTFIAYGIPGTSGSNTVTVNPQGSAGSFSWSQGEFHGVSVATPLDVDGGTSTGNIAAGLSFTATDAILIATANSVIISVCSQEGQTRTLSAVTGTLIGHDDTNASNQCHALQFHQVTTVTTYSEKIAGSSAGGDGAHSPGWAIQTASFAPASAILISPLDSSTVTDSPTVSIAAPANLTISVTDSSAVTESVTVSISAGSSSLTISVSDSSTVTDPKPTMLLISNINVSDSSAVTDSPTVRLTSNINVSDSSAVTDTNTVRIDFNINSNDSSTVTDSPQLMINQNINVSDSSVVTDSPSLTIDLNINQNESSTVTDSPNLNLSISLNVSDDSGVTEDVSISLGIGINVSDSSVVTESVTVERVKKNQAGAFLIMWLAGNG